MRHKGGSTSKKSNFNINKFLYHHEGLVKFISVQHNPVNNSLISLIKFSFGAYSYTITPHGCFPGSSFLVILNNYIYLYRFKPGFTTILKYFNNHALFFNFVLDFKKGSQYSKAPGTYCLMIQFNEEKKMSFIQLPTKKTLWVSWYCIGTFGRVANIDNRKQFLTKAGTNRHKNKRPTVRGVAMNPVDHPHGGRCKTNSPELTPWSKVAKFNN